MKQHFKLTKQQRCAIPLASDQNSLKFREGIRPFTVRAQWQQFGVRVGRSGHINVRGQSPKNFARPRQLRTALTLSFILRGVESPLHDH